ncbi:hypothetical protein AMATHDRAFT_49889 [Amanita thiersii Skay4041]|uniref:Uncharacterized protein n=1 Tax=Amanita thiersii Skay4041 TaxID=703135 RepID=A0A2A9NAE1_9AGAR|nr:hypothetical protein AMATHDRAFT_49889 [Amanita thiersii Skay4041]
MSGLLRNITRASSHSVDEHGCVFLVPHARKNLVNKTDLSIDAILWESTSRAEHSDSSTKQSRLNRCLSVLTVPACSSGIIDLPPDDTGALEPRPMEHLSSSSIKVRERHHGQPKWSCTT